MGCLLIAGTAGAQVAPQPTPDPNRYKHAYEFGADWFWPSIPNWEKHLAHMKGKPNLNYLEVGPFDLDAVVGDHSIQIHVRQAQSRRRGLSDHADERGLDPVGGGVQRVRVEGTVGPLLRQDAAQPAEEGPPVKRWTRGKDESVSPPAETPAADPSPAMARQRRPHKW